MAKKIKNDTPMDHALRHLGTRARTAREMENYLDGKNYGEFEVYHTVERLKELGYIDDTKFAHDFIESRLNSKPLSRKKLREQLYSRHVDKDIIDEALTAVTNEREWANAMTVTDKYNRQFEELDDYNRKQRVMKRLLGRGFEYAAIRDAVERLFGDSDGLDECQGDTDDHDAND